MKMHNEFVPGEVLLCSWKNNAGKQMNALYEFGYYTKYGCVVYIKGEMNMQDSYAFKLDQVRRATKSDYDNYYFGN